MLKLEPSYIAALRLRDVELAAALTRSEWAKLSLPMKAIQNLEKIYTFFDGFITADYRSQLRLWSISEISSGVHEIESSNLRPYLYIGDFLVESDYIRLDVGTGAVDFEGMSEKRSSDITEFVQRIAEGRFDFM